MTLPGAATVDTPSGSLPSDAVGVKRGELVSLSGFTALVAWVGLFLLCRFLWTKIEFSTQGTGWILLPAFALCAAVVVVARLARGECFILRGSFASTAIFLLYYLVRLGLDAESTADFTAYTMGYTHGILFAYGLGLTVRILVESASHPAAGRLRWVVAVSLLAFNAWNAVQVEANAFDAGDLHPVYAVVENETYQVSGMLASVIAVISAVTLFLSVPDNKQSGWKWQSVVLLVLATALIAVIARLAQLMGSNAGPAFAVPLAVIVIAVFLAPFGEQGVRWFGNSGGQQTVRASTLWGRARVVGGLCVGVSVLIGVAFYSAIAIGAIDVTRYRIFGFEESSLVNASLVARFEILIANFLVHLEHAPLFGDFFVDRHTTGSGTFVHSLLAMLPHLGIAGATLFCAMSVAVSNQLRSAFSTAIVSAHEQRFAAFSIAVTVWVTIFVLITAFFTSALLWLPLGLFAPAVQLAWRPPHLDDMRECPIGSPL